MLLRIRYSLYFKLILFVIVLLYSVFFLKAMNKIPNHGRVVKSIAFNGNFVDDFAYNKDSSDLEQMILTDLSKQQAGLGNNGEAVTLKGSSKLRGKEDLAKIALNNELSELLSYNRRILDPRSPLCERFTYDQSSLPTASVIIIFYNEPYSVLVRTLHSVLNTAGPQILKDLIIVDDGSSNADLHEKLDYYVATRLPDTLKIVRLKNRLGLIQARLAGARVARGEVLVFLDAHCECAVSWLEPLLARIQKSRTSVTVPIIDIIDANDFQYNSVGLDDFKVGGFRWSGEFMWIDIPLRERERQRRECPTEPEVCPTYSPTMAGGLFAISREYFWEIGSYDEQMAGWGGENVEMSFRIWQCGGTVEIIPCSRVGHVFREFFPYIFPERRDTYGHNTARMAQVWMDEYINLFYMNRPDLKNNANVGDVTQRRILRNELKCKDFDWYLKNIYPEKFIPTKNVKGYGRFVSAVTDLCFHDLKQHNEGVFNLGLNTCERPEIIRPQFFSFTRDGILRNELSCAFVQRRTSTSFLVILAPCHSDNNRNEKWKYSHGQFRHFGTNMCVDQSGLGVQDFLQVNICDIKSMSQRWRIEH